MNAIATQLPDEPERPLVPQSDTATVLSLISRVASDPNSDIDKMERLLAMHERMSLQQAEKAFNEALATVQASIGRIKTNKTNKQTGSAYANYAALDKVVRPVYSAHGFALSFGTEPTEGDSDYVRVTCHCSHRDGFTRKYSIDMPADGKGAKGNDVMTKTHATGSAMSYGQRYLLRAIFNLAISTDDDGNAAAGQGDPAQAEADARKMVCLEAAVRHAKAVEVIHDHIGRFDVSGDTEQLRTVAEAWAEIPETDQLALWLAPTKGGVLTTHEREVIKTKLPRLEPDHG